MKKYTATYVPLSEAIQRCSRFVAEELGLKANSVSCNMTAWIDFNAATAHWPLFIEDGKARKYIPVAGGFAPIECIIRQTEPVVLWYNDRHIFITQDEDNYTVEFE